MKQFNVKEHELPETTQKYIAEQFTMIDRLQHKIAAAAELAALNLGLDPNTAKLSEDFRSLKVVTVPEKPILGKIPTPVLARHKVTFEDVTDKVVEKSDEEKTA